MYKLVMVIEDAPTTRKIVEFGLRREGFEVKGFPDGIEALKWLKSSQGRIPDLIFLDIGLPKMDGYEVARRIKTELKLKNTVVVWAHQQKLTWSY